MVQYPIHLTQLSAEMVGLIAELEEFRGAWRSLSTLQPERLRSLRRVATIESIGSSTRIEGSRLSDRDVEELLGRVLTQSFSTRDEQEVAGYALAMDTVFTSYEHIPVDENHIKQLHAILLRHAEKDIRHRGEYKKVSNQVEAFDEDGRSIGVIFETSSPFDTPRHMGELVTWYREASAPGGMHPLLAIGVFVVVFLAIHPFQDGNGRLSRVLTTLLLLKAGYVYVPFSSMESVIERHKESYYLALRRTQATLRSETPDWEGWLVFFLRAMREQKRHLEAKVERDRAMRAELPELAVRIIELVREHGEVQVAGIMRATGSPRGTVKKWVTELTRRGYLKAMGAGRGTRYVAGWTK